MKLRLCIVSATPKLFTDAVAEATARATSWRDPSREKLKVLGFGNGCELPADPEQSSIIVAHSDQNMGVPAALHELWRMACELPDASPDDVLCYIHDDLLILEDNWDERILNVFRRDPRCGLAGFGGATALGGDEIYKKPYEIHQLGRRNFYSNMIGAECHGQRMISEMPIVFTDGQSMIVKRELLDKIGGWSWWPFHLIHHAYDYGIACMARRHGYTGWLVPCVVNHLGFQTASQPIYKNLADKYGGDAEVHRASHEFVYNTFRDVLPLRIR